MVSKFSRSTQRKKKLFCVTKKIKTKRLSEVECRVQTGISFMESSKPEIINVTKKNPNFVRNILQ